MFFLRLYSNYADIFEKMAQPWHTPANDTQKEIW